MTTARYASGLPRMAIYIVSRLAACLLLGATMCPAYAEDGPPIHFYADLSADEQSAYTESPGLGRVDFVLERATLRLSWTLTYDKLTSAPIGAGIHGPQTPGGNAGLLIDMAPEGMANPLRGSAVLTDGQLEYLLTGRTYVNLRTTKYKAGELRGQIMREPPSRVSKR